MVRMARSRLGMLGVMVLLPGLLVIGAGTVTPVQAAPQAGEEAVAVVGQGLCFVTTRDGQFLNLHRANVIGYESRRSGNMVQESCTSNVAYVLAHGPCTIVLPSGALLTGTPHTRPHRAGGTTVTCIGRLR